MHLLHLNMNEALFDFRTHLFPVNSLSHVTKKAYLIASVELVDHYTAAPQILV